MLEVLSKPLDEIGIADIQSLIDSEVPESERVEFKKELPGERGMPDPWANGENKIGNHAKDTILKEVVAFANAYGGVLFIGIEESDEKPAIASRISAIPRCADLSERLKLVFRDRVEPQLARLDIVGVPIEEESGVVVIRVGRSRLAPHRVTKTRICPIRRADRSEEMTMREIQDMTLNMSRGLERLEKRLSERSERFPEEFGRLERHENVVGIRLTAVPVVDEIRFERVFQQGQIASELEMTWRTVHAIQQNSNRQELRVPDGVWPSFWRPLLRGARAGGDAFRPDFLPPYFGYREIYCDGLIELGFVSIADEKYYLFHPGWPFAMFANLAFWASHVREKAGVPTVEYALAVETRNLGNVGFVASDGIESRLFRPFTSRPRIPNTKFPTYPLNGPDEIAELLSWFYRDFWNSMGEDGGTVHFVLG